MDRLYAHIHNWMATPFIWGEDDCMLAQANYLVRLGYIDCATRFRGKYDSALTCQRVSNFLFDPVKPFADCVAEIPLESTDEPQRGDVGVIKFRDADGKIKALGAIFLGRNWAMRGEHKVMIGPAIEVMAAWRVNPCAN